MNVIIPGRKGKSAEFRPYVAELLDRLVRHGVNAFHVRRLYPADEWEITVGVGYRDTLEACSTCWEFHAPTADGQALWCDLTLGHDGPHNAAQKATFERRAHIVGEA